MFFTLLGFAVCFGFTFGSAAYVLFLGYAQSKAGGPFPIGALIVAGMLIAMGCVVVRYAPFHLSISG